LRSNHYHTGKAVKETPFHLRAQLNVASMHLTTSSVFTLLREAEKAPPERAGMNRVSSVALAKEDTLRRVPPDEALWRGPHL